MDLEKRVKAFSSLGRMLQNFINQKNYTVDEWKSDFFLKLDKTIKNSQNINTWFIEGYVKYAINAIATNLTEEKIRQWMNKYSLSSFNSEKTKTIGVVMAGNIPLVGFFDFFYIMMSGNIVNVKLSSQDKQLLPLLAFALIQLEPDFKNYYTFTERQLKDIDAIIATGSNNTSKYFEYYFGKYPNIIRKNRNSVAVLTGNETNAELKLLGNDIFLYFGFGCRNVSKLYIPVGYDLNKIFRAIEDKKEIINNHKYFNNYEYNKAIYLINQTLHLDNGFILLKEDMSLHSPVGTLYYEYFKNNEDLKNKLIQNKEKIQCIVTNHFDVADSIKIGNTQIPGLTDYPDGIDVMNFIFSL